jgi:hypothetical protein
VLLALKTANHQYLLERTLMAQGQALCFEYEGEQYQVTLKRLVNKLVGRDFAVVTISPKKN